MVAFDKTALTNTEVFKALKGFSMYGQIGGENFKQITQLLEHPTVIVVSDEIEQGILNDVVITRYNFPEVDRTVELRYAVQTATRKVHSATPGYALLFL